MLGHGQEGRYVNQTFGPTTFGGKEGTWDGANSAGDMRPVTTAAGASWGTPDVGPGPRET